MRENQGEREFETGMDEFFKSASENNNNNMKRTYDMYQDFDAARVRSAGKNSDVIDNLAHQALQNAVETANMVSKQAVRHSDIAIDRQWNVDEVSTLTAKSGVESDAMMVALATAVAKILEKQS